MAMTEPQRLALHRAARATLGDEEGDALMTALPPSNTEIATRQDVEHLAALTRADLQRVETSLRGDMKNLETGLRGDMTQLEARMDARIIRACGELRDELTARIHRSELRTIAAVALAFIADRALG